MFLASILLVLAYLLLVIAYLKDERLNNEWSGMIRCSQQRLITEIRFCSD